MFTIDEKGLSGFRTTLDWKDLLEFQLFLRPEQQNRTHVPDRVWVRVLRPDFAAIDYYDSASGTMVPVEVRVDTRYLRVSILAGDIVEDNSSSWRLMRVAVASSLLDAQTDEAGSYLLPVFGGGLASFRKTGKLRTLDRIYMQQSEWEKFGFVNAFGAQFGKGAVLGIVHSGDFRAWIETTFNDAPDRTRQRLVFGIRHAASDFPEQEAKTVLFRELPDARDYTDMAFAFREYLLDERGLTPLRERMRGNAVLDYAVKAMRTKIFFGIKKPFVSDGIAPYNCCTTFAEAETMLLEMHRSGITKAIVTLVGWNTGGHDGAYPTHFPVNVEAGGEEALRHLIALAKELGYQIVPHDNSSSMYQCSPAFDRFYISKDENGETQNSGLWAGGLTYLTCPQVFMQRFGGEFHRIRDLGFEGSYYIDGLGTGLFRCSDPAHPANEKELALGQMRALGYVRMLYGSSSTENPAVYTLPYIDEAAHIPCGNRCAFFRKRLPTEFNAICDRAVPFFHIAVHGIITYQSGWIHTYRDDGLKGVLTLFVEGSRPSMEVSERALGCGDDFRASMKDILEPYKVAFEMIGDVHEAFFASYRECAPDAVRVRYDNGVEMDVNATDAEVDGMPPASLVVRRDGKTVYTLAK